MLEFLIGNFYRTDSFEGQVTEFNEKTNKLIVNGIDNYENEKTIEINVFGSELEQNIQYYENWNVKLYTELKNKGKTDISILSTESGDNWTVEIYRNETPLDIPKYNVPVTLINYTIVFCGEVKGKVLSFQKNYEQDEKKKFIDWINEQIEEVSEFNNTECWNTISTIIVSDAFNSREEVELIMDLFDEYSNSLGEE